MSKESSLKNLASERAVLAGLVQHGVDCLVDIEILIDEEVFSLDHNKILFKCLADALSKNDSIGFADILSSAKSLGLNEYVERPDVMKHANGIINTPIHLENVRSHAEKIRRLQFARNLQNQLRDIYRGLDEISGDESITEILSIAEAPIQETCMSYMKEDDTTPGAENFKFGKNLYIAPGSQDGRNPEIYDRDLMPLFGLFQTFMMMLIF